MASLKWVKIVTDLFENPKISAIESMKNSDKIIVIWMKTLCFAGKCNNGGLLSLDGRIPFTVPMLSTAFHRDEKIVQNAFDVFFEYGMLEKLNGFICVCNWEKHQATDKIDTINKRHALDQKNYRDRMKNKTVISQGDNALHHSDTHGDIDVSDAEVRVRVIHSTKEKEGEKKTHETPPSKSLIPTLDEVRLFKDEQTVMINGKAEKFVSDPEKYFNQRQSTGWKSGKFPIVDWQYDFCNWELRERGFKAERKGADKPDVHIDWLDNYLASIDKGAN